MVLVVQAVLDDLQERSRIAALQRDPLAADSLENLTRQTFRAFRDRRLALVSGSTVARELALISASSNPPGRHPPPAQVCSGLREAAGPARPARRQAGQAGRLKFLCTEYLKAHPELEIDKSVQHKLLITVAPDGYLKRVA